MRTMLAQWLGRVRSLKCVKPLGKGWLVAADTLEAWAAERELPEKPRPGLEFEGTLYKDGEGRLRATTLKPKLETGRVGLLTVKSQEGLGYYLDWGLEKDLMLPKGQWFVPPRIGQELLVRVLFDEASQSLYATAKISRSLEKVPSGPPAARPQSPGAPALDPGAPLRGGQKVELIPFKAHELGWLCVVDQRWSGLLYRNECAQPPRPGQVLEGWVKAVRADGKVDLTLLGGRRDSRLEHRRQELIELIQAHGGFLPLTDRSAPETVRQWTGWSKKEFKEALGGLYRERLVKLESEGVRWVGPT